MAIPTQLQHCHLRCTPGHHKHAGTVKDGNTSIPKIRSWAFIKHIKSALCNVLIINILRLIEKMVINFNLNSSRRYTFLVFCLMLFFNNAIAKEQKSVNYLPQTPAYSEIVSTFIYEGVSQGQRLAAVSLQGLVNRDTARIYLRERQSSWLLDFY